MAQRLRELTALAEDLPHGNSQPPVTLVLGYLPPSSDFRGHQISGTHIQICVKIPIQEIKYINKNSQAQWHKPITPAPERQRQGNQELKVIFDCNSKFEVILNYMK